MDLLVGEEGEEVGVLLLFLSEKGLELDDLGVSLLFNFCL